MSKPLISVLVALALCGANGVQAQTLTGNINQPAVSPYLNITRGGASAGLNYYNIVQPQLQFNSAINQLQVQQDQGTAGTNPSGVLTTGHSIQFNNYSHFYPQRGVGVGSVTGQVRATAASSPYGVQQNVPKNPLGSAPAHFTTGQQR